MKVRSVFWCRSRSCSPAAWVFARLRRRRATWPSSSFSSASSSSAGPLFKSLTWPWSPSSHPSKLNEMSSTSSGNAEETQLELWTFDKFLPYIRNGLGEMRKILPLIVEFKSFCRQSSSKCHFNIYCQLISFWNPIICKMKANFLMMKYFISLNYSLLINLLNQPSRFAWSTCRLISFLPPTCFCGLISINYSNDGFRMK